MGYTKFSAVGLPQKDWSKPGAFKDSATAKPKSEWIAREIEHKLYEWDFLPIREKIMRIQNLRDALELKAKPPRAFRFLLRAQPSKKLDKIKMRLDKRLAEEKQTYEEMGREFRHWGVNLKNLNIGVGDISHPYKTKMRYIERADRTVSDFWHKEPIWFKSPSMSKWHEEKIVASGRRPSSLPLGTGFSSGTTEKRMYDERAFGMARMDVNNLTKDATVYPLQPFTFYKREENSAGRKETALNIPLQHPELLILYKILEENTKHGIKETHVVLPFGMTPENYSMDAMYRKIAKISPNVPPMRNKSIPVRFVRKAHA
jgi:hypothetical protein